MERRRANIVFILVGEAGWRDLGCYGSDFHETPALDRLAAEGMTFTDAYAAGRCASPSVTASLLTGKYPARVGVTHWIGGHGVGRLSDVPYFPFLPSDEHSLARALRDAGYQTGTSGRKWHLGARES